VALLVFPANPVNGQLYPTNPVAGQYQYQWSSAEQTWRLLGAATGVTPGTYCPTTTSAPRITVDALGRISLVQCVELEFVKLNNPNAYNNYTWPIADGNPADVLATDGAGNLFWLPQSGGGGGGGVIFVGAGVGLSTTTGLPITTGGTINLNPATTFSLGGVIPDGTSITVSPAGVISAAVPPVGLGLTINGGFSKVAIPTLSSPPAAGAGSAQAVPGSMYWDTTLGELYIYYNDGTTSQWVAASPGAAPLAAGNGLIQQAAEYKLSVTASSIPPAAGSAAGQAADGSLYYDTDLGALFYLYNDGFTTQWVQV
jgi:hypothetical protein